MDEIKIKKELERLKWLRKAAYMMPSCKTADETSIKVTNLTILGGEMAFFIIAVQAYRLFNSRRQYETDNKNQGCTEYDDRIAGNK